MLFETLNYVTVVLLGETQFLEFACHAFKEVKSIIWTSHFFAFQHASHIFHEWLEFLHHLNIHLSTSWHTSVVIIDEGLCKGSIQGIDECFPINDISSWESFSDLIKSGLWTEFLACHFSNLTNDEDRSFSCIEFHTCWECLVHLFNDILQDSQVWVVSSLLVVSTEVLLGESL